LRVAIFEPGFLIPQPNATTNVVIIQEQARILASLGIEVVVLTESVRESEPVEIHENYTIYPLQGKFISYGSLFSPARRSIQTYSGLFSPDIFTKAIKILKKEPYADVIYTCGSLFSGVFTAMLGYLTNTPTVHYLVECPRLWRWWRADVDAMKGYKVPFKDIFGEFVKNALRELPRRDFLAKWGSRHITQIVVSSDHGKRRLQGLGLDTRDIPVVYPGVNISPLKNKPEKTDVPIITYFGHLWQGRGVLDLLMAFSHVIKQHSKTKLMVATNNVHELTEHYFKKLITEYELDSNVIQKGIVKDVYSEILAPTTLVVLPYRDAPSIKLIESMAAAKPVITTMVGWTPELIVDGVSGFLVDVGNPKGIASRVNMLLNDTELMEQIGGTAREIAKSKCSLSTNTRVTLDILQKARHEKVK